MKYLLCALVCAALTIGAALGHDKVTVINPKDHEYLGLLSCITVFSAVCTIVLVIKGAKRIMN